VRTVLAKHDLLPRGLQPEGLSIETGRVTVSAEEKADVSAPGPNRPRRWEAKIEETAKRARMLAA